MSMEDVALGMTCLCVRNTIIEQYHADGKLTDAEMKAFNKEVANKLYTALATLANGDEKRSFALQHLCETNRPHNWDTPELDKGFTAAIDRIVSELDQAQSQTPQKRSRRYK